MQIVPEPFELELTIKEEHYRRSDLIASLERITTVSNNPVALAIQEAIDEKCIRHHEIYAVIDPYGLGVYFKLYQIFNDETWLLQANCYEVPETSSLLRALQNQERFSLNLTFYPIGCCSFNSDNTQSKIFWRPLLVDLVKLALIIVSVVKVLEFFIGATGNILLATATIAILSVLLLKFISNLFVGFYTR